MVILPPSPVLSINFSLPEIFWNTARKGSPTKISTLRDKKLSTETIDTPPLSINILASGIFLNCSTEELLYETFRYCETTKIRRKNVNPPLLSLTIFDTRNWWNTKGFPYETFRHWDKNFSKERWYSPGLIHKLFATGKFLKHSTEGLPHENFDTARQKTFDGNSWYSHPPLVHNHFG